MSEDVRLTRSLDIRERVSDPWKRWLRVPLDESLLVCSQMLAGETTMQNTHTHMPWSSSTRRPRGQSRRAYARNQGHVCRGVRKRANVPHDCFTPITSSFPDPDLYHYYYQNHSHSPTPRMCFPRSFPATSRLVTRSQRPRLDPTHNTRRPLQQPSPPFPYHGHLPSLA